MKHGCTLLLGLLLCHRAAFAQSDYIGVYSDRPGDYIAIAPIGKNQALLMASTRTEQLRLLFPAGRDSFYTGAFIAQPEPREDLLFFERAATAVTQLHMRRVAGGRTYPRIPLRQEQIEVGNAGIVLRGALLSLPHLRGKRPAIVFAHGSEDNDRNSSGPLPWVLAAHGYRILIYDKRGTGGSGGSWQDVGIEPLGSDLAAMVRCLAARPDDDATRIAVIGTSEGGWVAADALAHHVPISAIIAISGGARTKGDAYIHKMRMLAIEKSLAGAALDSAVAEASLTIRESTRRVALNSGVTGFDLRVAYDPTRHWKKFRGAFLYLGGASDVLEPATESAAWFENIMSRKAQADYTTKVFPRAHHSLLQAVTGTPSEFATLSGIREFAPGYWSVLLRWLDDRLLRP